MNRTCKFAASILLISLAACTKAPEQKAPAVPPLTQAERLAMRDGQMAIFQAQRRAQNAPEQLALQKAQEAVSKTKEFAAFNKAQKALNDTAEMKAFRAAQDAVNNSATMKEPNELTDKFNAAADLIFTSREISKDDWVICDGGGADAIDSCKDVAPGEIALRPRKKGK